MITDQDLQLRLRSLRRVGGRRITPDTAVTAVELPLVGDAVLPVNIVSTRSSISDRFQEVRLHLRFEFEGNRCGKQATVYSELDAAVVKDAWIFQLGEVGVTEYDLTQEIVK